MPNKETVPLFRAMWKPFFGKGEAPRIEVEGALFDRRPNSWLCSERLGAFGYRSTFRGKNYPGFLTKAEAVEDLVEQQALHVRDAERELRDAKYKLSIAEACLDQALEAEGRA